MKCVGKKESFLVMMKTRKVNLFIVGAAKSGTTSLWAAFRNHPEVFVTEDELFKEPAFFSKLGSRMGLDKYHRLYAGAKDEKYICDASTAYLTSAESAERILEYNPEAKILIILRNPVDRAYSLYNWMVSDGYEWAPSFEYALNIEGRRFSGQANRVLMPQYFWNYMYYRSGLYSEQIERYLLRFGYRLKIVNFHDLITKTRSAFDEILDFLGISMFSLELPRENPSRSSIYPPMTFATRYLSNSLNRFRRCKTKSERDTLLNLTLTDARPSKLTNSLYRTLEAMYDEEFEILEKRYAMVLRDPVIKDGFAG